jgi:2,3-bisphosphoglycerate-independent phosphoglycerate mutase
MAVSRGARDVRVHAFLDGRDTPPRSGTGFVAALEHVLAETGGAARIATVAGRYWAMDRDNRWDRVERAWRAIVLAEGERAATAAEAVERSYAADETDEFVAPTAIDGYGGVADGDAVVFFNFRPDRARELTRAFTDASFAGFERPRRPDVRFVCLTEYDPTIPAEVAFAKDLPTCVLADVLADAGLTQLHIAETEKYAHVTFFFNGGSEPPRPGEERILVASPHVATYDLKPEMSAPQVADELVGAIRAGRADVYIVNFANGDMVGHTGVFEAAVAAVEAVDHAVGRVVEALVAVGGQALVTADHGNAERMVDADGATPFTAHTTDDVPLLVISDRAEAVAAGGRLADVAPTLLALIGLPAPASWTGRCLVRLKGA